MNAGGRKRNILLEIGIPQCFREHDSVTQSYGHRKSGALCPFESRIDQGFELLWKQQRVALSWCPSASEDRQ